MISSPTALHPGKAGPRRDVAGRFCASDGGKALTARRARLGDDVEVGVAPVARHLPAPRSRVLRRADSLEHHGLRAHAEGEDEGPVAVVGEEPVRCRAEATWPVR